MLKSPTGRQMETSGSPSADAGRLPDDAGTVAGEAGIVTAEAGRPSDGAGTMTDDAGRLSAHAGSVMDDAGKPSDDAGTVTDNAGRPSDDAGTSSDDAGTSSERQKPLKNGKKPGLDRSGGGQVSKNRQFNLFDAGNGRAAATPNPIWQNRHAHSFRHLASAPNSHCDLVCLPVKTISFLRS